MPEPIGPLDFIEGYVSPSMLDPTLLHRVHRVIGAEYRKYSLSAPGIEVHTFAQDPSFILISDTGYFPPEVSWIPYEQQYRL
jgi:hypothetical protein